MYLMPSTLHSLGSSSRFGEEVPNSFPISFPMRTGVGSAHLRSSGFAVVHSQGYFKMSCLCQISLCIYLQTHSRIHYSVQH
jgi:hypothetical protein